MQLLRDAYDIFGAAPVHFGALLRMLRDRHGISQAAVVAHLPETISQRRYSSFELDGRSPRFDELTTLYRALYQAGVHYTIQDRRLFLALAQQKFASKKTHKAPASEEEWERLRLELAQIDHLPDEASLRRQAVVTQNAPLPRRETGHLLGREGWLNLLFGAVQQPSVTKVIIVQGPPGSGKTSELHRIANHYLQSIPRYHIVLCQPSSIELDRLGPEIALELLLGNVLEVVGSPYASLPTTSLQARVKYVLECLARADRPVLILLDNAEHTLDEQGDLVPVWRQFLQKFVHTRHYACLVLTTQEWPGAFLEEPQLVMHTMIPPLSQAEGSVLLWHLGLQGFPKEQLGPLVEAVGGIPLVRQNLSGDQVRTAEDRLIRALTHWLDRGMADLREQCGVFTGLASLLLRRHRLLAAAELILYHGWLTSQVGQILRLAQLVRQVLDERPWDAPPDSEAETESGRILLHYYLDSYLGVSIDARERAEYYEQIRTSVAAGQVMVESLMEVHLVDQVMLFHLNEDRFEDAQRLLENCFRRLEPLFPGDAELQATVLSKRATLYNRRSTNSQAQGRSDEARQLREQAIAVYEVCLRLLEEAEQGVAEATLRKSTLKKKRATFLNNLAYQLNVLGRFEEALKAVNRCLDLKEQGYAERDSLAAAVGEKSQILAALGKFQEALRLDALAREEVRLLAAAGDTMSLEEQWIYQVNQGRLYLLLGRVDQAERLLLEAESRVHSRRKAYKVLANALLKEIDQWRTTSRTPHYQLDWRWVERYRNLSAYDSYWWLAHAGPFSEEEQRQWDQQFFPSVDDAAKDRLRCLLLQSRDRELAATLADGREPRLCYPAIEIEAVRERIAAFLELGAEVNREEPNAIVRRLYHGAIEEEVCFLRMIEATAEGNRGRFWELTQQLYPAPTREEMQYALARVKQVVLEGLLREDTVQVSQRVIRVLCERFDLEIDLSPETEAAQDEQKERTGEPPRLPRMVAVQAARRFFEAILRESGYEGWQVVLDPNASGPRVESGLRHLFLPDSPISLEEIREYVSHELLGHVARSIAGERSPIGLLGIGTKGYMPTEEGLADYHERHVAALHGQPFDDSGTWLGTLAVGLASGVVTPPQTFSSLFSFFEPFLLLYRLLWRDDEDRPTAEQRARRNAFARCLRTFRGVPNVERPGVCFTKDVVYLRGLWSIEQAVAKDETILDRLAAGKVALELLPDLQELEIVAPHQLSLLRKLAYDPGLDSYILSYEDAGDHLSNAIEGSCEREGVTR